MLPRIYLCWFPLAARTQVHSLQTITQLMAQTNSRSPVALAKSMRLNWMVNDIQTNGMLKPIVVNNDWQTIVGDTRLMAADLLAWQTVPVLAQLSQPRHQVISCEQELLEHCGVYNTVLHDQKSLFTDSVDWVDFDMVGSRSHWHDSAQRLQLMQRYLESQPIDFTFDINWYRSLVDWTQWSI